ncbi:MAG: universal stress protein [Pseudomonadota bacterium]
MNKILIPLADLSELSLNAAHYAVEFAKRSGSKPIFLFFSETERANADPLNADSAPSAQKECEIREKIEVLIDRSAVDGLDFARYECCGEYIEKVCEFVRNLNIAEIVIAIPDDKQDELYDKIEKDISLLVQMTPCRILTVKEKHKGE